MQKPQSIEKIEASNYNCPPCSIGVDDYGSFMCKYCRASFTTNQSLKVWLKRNNGDEWESEYNKLIGLKMRVKQRSFEWLKLLIVIYRDSDQKIVNQRKFYEFTE